MNARALLLSVLQAAFLFRVIGQIEAEFVAPAWLPAVEHWDSGLLPYHLLLLAQILILMFMSLVTYDAWRGAGIWHVRKMRTRQVLKIIAMIYMAIMATRYVVSMTLVPEMRWFGHSIPIFFHFVLATYLYVLSRIQANPDGFH